MKPTRTAFLAGALTAALYAALSFAQAAPSLQPQPSHEPTSDLRPSRSQSFDRVIASHARSLFEEGRAAFRHDTFGTEDFWGGALRLHEAIAGSAHGGIGPGLSPRAALELGLKIDVDALTPELREALRPGATKLEDPNVTLDLLRAGAIVGLTGFFDAQGGLRSVGAQCALCHATVDHSFAPGVGARLDGWANRDLDIGELIANAPDLDPIASRIARSADDVKKALKSWGPGKYDALLLLDGKLQRPDGKPAATLIPPVFGLAGIQPSPAWGSLPHGSALFVHGKGTYFDPRLDDADRFPAAAANRSGHVMGDPDLVTGKLPALQLYVLSLPAPAPPPESYDRDAASRGRDLFRDKARCVTCHTEGLHAEPGWSLHRAEEIGIDAFQADRYPDRRHRTAPLRGLWSHAKGGFYHDGRFATLADVVGHYESVMALGLTETEKGDLVEYLKSLGGNVEPTIASVATLNAPTGLTSGGVVLTGGWRVAVRPTPAVRGVPVRILLEGIAAGGAPKDLATFVVDERGRVVTRIDGFTLEPARAVATSTWDGRDAEGKLVPRGVYYVRVSAPSIRYQEDRELVLR